MKIAVLHPDLRPGDACPGCEKGKIYQGLTRTDG
jgi:hypothetical protein